MKIECTQEEFETLLDMIYAGSVLINSTKSDEERIKKYFDMEQYFFKEAVERGLTEFIAFDETYQEYMPTRVYEDGEVNTYIDTYDDRVFWEELVLRLARRDVLNEVGDVNPDMTKAEVNTKQLALEEMYEDEFFYHGLSRLKITPLESDGQ
jgi:hypothetical protein